MKDLDCEDNATIAALERYRAQGSDLSRPMKIDFFVAAPAEDVANAVAQQCRPLGFTTTVERTEATGDWTCYCAKTIIPSYENVRAIERDLDRIARACGGHADGFGSFGNAPA
jgi:hypothetical protein